MSVCLPANLSSDWERGRWRLRASVLTGWRWPAGSRWRPLILTIVQSLVAHYKTCFCMRASLQWKHKEGIYRHANITRLSLWMWLMPSRFKYYSKYLHCPVRSYVLSAVFEPFLRTQPSDTAQGDMNTLTFAYPSYWFPSCLTFQKCNVITCCTQACWKPSAKGTVVALSQTHWRHTALASVVLALTGLKLSMSHLHTDRQTETCLRPLRGCCWATWVMSSLLNSR